MMMMLIMRARRTSACLAMVVALVACGGDGDDENAATSVAASPSTTSLSAETAAGSGTTEAHETVTSASTEPATTVAPATTVTTAPPTTVDRPTQVIELLAEFQETGDPAGLALFAPLSPAAIYYDGVVLLEQFGEQFPPTSATPVDDGGFRITDSAGGSVVLDDFKFDDAGLITDLSRDGVPVSQTVVGIGQTYNITGLAGTIHSARHFDGELRIVMKVESSSSFDAAFYLDSYVVDGRQLSPIPTSSLSNTIRPGVTAAYIFAVEGAGLGGTAYGQLSNLADGSDFEYVEIETAIPAPG